MTDVHFLTASLSLFEREMVRVRQSKGRKLKRERRNERERENSHVSVWTGPVLMTPTRARESQPEYEMQGDSREPHDAESLSVCRCVCV